MRLAMAQMSMLNDFEKNFKKSLQFMDLADEHKADLIFFPQLQLTPYFPQYPKGDVGGALNHVPAEFAVPVSGDKIRAMAERCKKYGFYASPNIYARDKRTNNLYDMSLWLTPRGKLEGKAKLVHSANRPNFNEYDYCVPSEQGFKVFDTPFGKVGIVISFDRHFPESISTCAQQGARLVIIPTANVDTEPLDMYEMELRVASFQNGVFTAMCNRVGTEGNLIFAGSSVVVDPKGDIVVRADDSQQFLICNIELEDVLRVRKKVDYGRYRRPHMYQ